MKLIVACDPSGGIGYKNDLPWDTIPGDLERFKKLTTNKIIVMGRNTWESLPIKPLPNRQNFVVTSSSDSLVGAVSVKDLTPFKNNPNVWLIGGAKLIESNWDYINEVHLTKTFNRYTCDSAINLLYMESNFNCVSSEYHETHIYQIWKRK